MTYLIQKEIVKNLNLLDLYHFEKVFGVVKTPLHCEEIEGEFMCPICFHANFESFFKTVFGNFEESDPRIIGIRYDFQIQPYV